jgi:ATP-dependent DNA helicase DinG
MLEWMKALLQMATGNAPRMDHFLPLRQRHRALHHPIMIGLNDAFMEGSVEDSPQPDLSLLVEEIFSRGGILEEQLKLDYRPQQESMASRTLGTWEQDEALFFEAGTGVGKSLAYLVPGILRAMAAGRPLVVSTHTIALQEQIERKDLPLCRKLFSSTENLQPYAGFRHAVLLGRGNYLCGARLAQALKSRTELFPSSEQDELARIAEWARSTETGLVQELSPQPLPEVWDWVQADGHACNSRNCSPKTCYFRKAREAVRQANVIVVNHSLLFALLAAGHFPGGNVPGILFPEDFMVVDEAHTLPAIATEYFGLKLSALG